MLIDKITKSIVERSEKPNENWIGDTHYLVDSNSDLAKKIKENYPHFDFVLNDSGDLIDVELTEKPITKSEPTTEEMLLEMDYRLTCIELSL